MRAWLLCALLSSQVYGEVSRVEIRNFNFNYKAPSGEGIAESFTYNKSYNQGQSVKVDRVGDDFDVILEGVENRYLTFKGAPGFMTGADFMKLDALYLKISDSFSFSLASGYFQSPFRILELNNFKLHCVSTNTCFENMGLTASAIHSDGEGLVEIFSGSTPVVDVKDLNLKVHNGKFVLTGDVKAQLSGRVRSRGEIKYQDGKITLRVEEVKFGILNVTSKVFEELKKHESEKLRVKFPHIYIQLK